MNNCIEKYKNKLGRYAKNRSEIGNTPYASPFGCLTRRKATVCGGRLKSAVERPCRHHVGFRSKSVGNLPFSKGAPCCQSSRQFFSTVRHFPKQET
jgi:hypothetical protein